MLKSLRGQRCLLTLTGRVGLGRVESKSAATSRIDGDWRGVAGGINLVPSSKGRCHKRRLPFPFQNRTSSPIHKRQGDTQETRGIQVWGAMADYHFVYKDVEGTSTEWDDIQRKLGNLPPKPAPERPAPWSPAPDEKEAHKDKEWLANKNEDELEDLADDPDLDDDRFLEEYRKKRLVELREVVKKARFGWVQPITGPDFIREVSHAPPDVWVVVLLYKDGVPECSMLGQCLDELAAKYPGTKFVKIVSTDCIKDYPDFNLPTVLVYNNTNVKATLVGLQKLGGRRCTSEDVAFTLCQIGPVLTAPGVDDTAATEKVRQDFLEKMISKHEQEEGNQSEDD